MDSPLSYTGSGPYIFISYSQANLDQTLPGYDRLELSRSTPEQSFSFDVSDANFITFALKPKDGSVASGLMLTDCYLYQ